MRNASFTLALAAAATFALPAASQAQLTDAVGRVLNGGIESRTDARVGTRSGSARRVNARDARDVPPGHLPGRGQCRVWIDGVAPGRQPRVTDCTTAERQAAQYGNRARVIYGSGTRYDDRYGNASRQGRTYETTINGRRCRVQEWYDAQGRLRQNTVCESDSARNRSTTRGPWDILSGRTTTTSDGRVYRDDDDDRWEDRDRDRDWDKEARKREKEAARYERKADKARGKAEKARGKGRH